jgi:hypothetical protein
MHEMGGSGGGGSDDKAAAAAAAEKALENSKEETKRAIEEGNKVRAALASAAAATHRATRECETLKKEVQSVKEDAAKEVGKYRSGAFYLTPVPVRPRSRGERRFLRTFSPARVSLRPGSLAFDPDTPRCLSTPPLTPFDSAPTSSLRAE